MADDPRLPKMPDNRPLFDFSATASAPPLTCCRARGSPKRNGVSEKIVLACLLHDIAIAGFIRSDHGYWSAQLLEPTSTPR